MAEVKKIFGRAGTGKTTELLKELDILLKSGIHPRNIAMVTHTRAGARIFKERAINEFDINSKDLKYFGTMHSLSWKVQDLVAENIFGFHEMEDYIDVHHLTSSYDDSMLEHYRVTDKDRLRLKNIDKINAMIQIDSVLSGCDISDFDFLEMEALTGRGLEYKAYYLKDSVPTKNDGKYKFVWSHRYETLDPSEQKKFSLQFRQHLTDNDLFTHARNLESMCDLGLALPCEYLIFDEFQDFNRLQYRIFCNWINASHVKRVILAGDDAQCIYGFSSASPRFMLDIPAEVVHLPVTYRHGRNIIDNAQEMIDHMSVVERFDIAPAPNVPDGEVLKLYGEDWHHHVNFNDPDETVLVLAATNDWAQRIRFDLIKAFPDVLFVNLEDAKKVERVFGMYNIIASLERGEEVPGKNERMGDKWTDIESLFSGGTKTSLPKKTLYKHPSMAFSAVDRSPEMTNILRHGIKKEIRTDKFDFKEYYDKDSFEKEFLKVPWVGKWLANAIPGIEIVENVMDIFPEYLVPEAKKRIGTIHGAKGDEADTVLLFMGISYPAYIRSNRADVRDDILRQFYVGKTRARTKLIEIYHYLTYPDGLPAPAPLDVIA
jgi:superfamily I DNA/RNA helicase